ncbi:MAG: heme ABC transporter ATP-binding protein [Rhodovibrionaceae bacterium]
MLEATDIHHAFGPQPVLAGATLRVAPGEVHALLGPNGAGKSTLLKILAGELTPQSGAVRMGGRPLADWHPLAAAWRRAVVPQFTSITFPFTAAEVVALGRAPHSRRGAEQIGRLALAAAGAGHLAKALFPTLSGGERQRVALARGLAQIWEAPPDGGPRYLLLDEPTASLDLAHQHAILALARDWAAEGVAVAVVLHDLNLAAAYADRITLLHCGQIRASGSPDAVLQPELISEVYGIAVTRAPHPDSGLPVVLARPRMTAETEPQASWRQSP